MALQWGLVAQCLVTGKSANARRRSEKREPEGGKYTKKTSPLNKEGDEREEGLWHGVHPQPSDENLLKEAEREGSWGRLLAGQSDRFREDKTCSTFFPCETQTYTRHHPPPTPVLTHTCTRTHTQPLQTSHVTIRLVHKHADLYKGRTLRSHADGTFRYFCRVTQICLAGRPGSIFRGRDL